MFYIILLFLSLSSSLFATPKKASKVYFTDAAIVAQLKIVMFRMPVTDHTQASIDLILSRAKDSAQHDRVKATINAMVQEKVNGVKTEKINNGDNFSCGYISVITKAVVKAFKDCWNQ